MRRLGWPITFPFHQNGRESGVSIYELRYQSLYGIVLVPVAVTRKRRVNERGARVRADKVVRPSIARHKCDPKYYS